jgi:apolipoprotein D and lipocalin family protein
MSVSASQLLLLLSCLSLFFSSCDAGCRSPPAAAGFTNQKYSGDWFEIGKIQTWGGAFFEKDCVCTGLTYEEQNSQTGDSKVVNFCRDKTPSGKYTNITGTLYSENMQNQGAWLEKIDGYGTGVANYTIIAIDDSYAVEYDCTTTLGITNYCIHVLSRTRTMDPAVFNKLIAQAEALDLNPQNLEVKMTKQDGC